MAVGDVTFSSDDTVKKSPNDQRLYRYIELQNGLCALLVHDPEIYAPGPVKASGNSQGTEDDDEEEESDYEDEEEDEEGDDEGEEGDGDDEDESEGEEGNEDKKDSSHKKVILHCCSIIYSKWECSRCNSCTESGFGDGES